MKLPLELVRAGSKRVLQAGETRNVSSGGVLFSSEAPFEIGELIEYFITLPTSEGEGKVRLRCLGRVIRLDPDCEPSGAVAATVERYEFVRLR